MSPQNGSILSKDKSSGDSTEVCLRLQPFEVEWIKVPMPANSSWRERESRGVNGIPSSNAQGRAVLERVDDVLALNPQLTAAEVIDQRIHDQLSRDEEGLRGRRDIMTEGEFKDAVRKRTATERSCKMEDCHAILLEDKKKQLA